jgi:hypothetical protein
MSDDISLECQNPVSHNQNLLVELVFKPLVPNLKLRPQESQLLLAYIGGILKEIEAEEKRVIEEERDKPCK